MVRAISNFEFLISNHYFNFLILKSIHSKFFRNSKFEIRNFRSGFTLIELLVVVAIIGILSSVALASLNSARTKAADASLKDHLAQLRTQIEVEVNNTTNFSYGGPTYGQCVTSPLTTDSALLFNKASVTKILKGIATASGATVDASNKIANSKCSMNTTSYRASFKLKSGNYICIDSSGAVKDTYTVAPTFVDTLPNAGTADYVCP